MSILDRNKVKGRKIDLNSEPNDLSFNIELPDIIEVETLVEILFLVHSRRNLKPRLSFVAYLRGAKSLFSKYGGRKAAEAIIEAGSRSSHPFTFKYVERVINEQNQS